jgi:SSS family solute:Na+ symporter
MPTLIILSGFVITIYPLFGGTEGVIWTGVVQAIVLVLGAAACLLVLLINTPGGPAAIVEQGVSAGKFSLGPYDPSFTYQTFWVVLFYGMATNLQNFGIDQSYVQRYITAHSDAAARRSVWMSALCYIPLSAGFLFIGTALFVFYALQPEQLPAGTKPDDVFPHFLHTQLPLGLRGLVLAAICSAAMDSNLNCCATLYLCDLHKRYIHPQAGDSESLWVLRITTLVMGAISTAAAIKMIEVKSILDHWWSLASICSGGTLGLFLLGRMSRRPRSLDAFLGTVCGVAVILWMTLFPRTEKLSDWWRSPFHTQMAIVFGTLTILLVGGLLSLLRPAPQEELP